MRKTCNFFYAFLLAVLGVGATIMAEDITLTAYYPAPYGAYEKLSTTGNTYLATNSGNVGIGMTAPSSLVHIYESVNLNRAQLLIENPNTIGVRGDAVIELRTRSSSFYVLSNDDLDEFYITDPTPPPSTARFMIDGNGNVGIATISPRATLDVYGTIAVNGMQGASGSFSSSDGKTATVTNGVITDITGP